MEDFSTGDRVRAVLSPLACCLPTCHLAASPSSESLNNNNTDAPTSWYAQSRPEASGTEANVPGNWEDAEERASRREADLLSLHEGVAGNGGARRRWRGHAGGDISGSGSVAGSGLSRWTLLRSWWTGRGAVRLADSDDEDENADERVPTDEEDGQLTFDEAIASHGDGDADARPLPAPFFPERRTPTSAPEVAPEPVEETAEERAQRRAQRRARRRARELGLSIKDFDEGAVAEPGELLNTPLLDVPTGGRSRARTQASSSSGGSTDPDFVLVDTRDGARQLANGSHGFDWQGVPSPLPVEDDGGMDGGDELFGRDKEKKERRSRRKRGTDEGGSSHSGDGTRRGVGSSTGSSGHSNTRSSRSQASTAHTSILASQVPLPSSPSQSQYSHSSPDPNRPRNRHRSHPSTSTTSTSASSSGRRRHKTHHASQLPDQVELPESPQYYQDENGQIQPFPVHEGQPGQWFVDDAGQHVFVPLAPQQQQQQQQHQPQQAYFPSPLDFSLLPHNAPQPSYEHIGTLAPILPIPSTLDVATPEVEELAEELADTTLTPESSAIASSPFADPLEFLKALKRTKLAPATPTAVVPPPAVKVTSDSDENPLLDQWEGLGKGAATRSAWEGAGEVEGAEGSHWRSATGASEEDESEDAS